MTDNGVSFRSKRYDKALRMLKIKHKRTRPYTPKTNGKAERVRRENSPPDCFLIRLTPDLAARIGLCDALRAFRSATKALKPFLHHDNHNRPHFGLNGKTPISRIPSNNLSRHDT